MKLLEIITLKVIMKLQGNDNIENLKEEWQN